jgi:hypothetical protein
MEGDIRKLLGHDKGPVVDDLVGAVINLIALLIFGTEPAIGGEKCECTSGTAPLQGRFGSATWSADDTPGRKPSSAMVLSATSLNLALVRISRASSHRRVRRHSPTRGEATAAAVVVVAAEAVPLSSSAPPHPAASRARLAARISRPNRRRVGMRHSPWVRRHHQRDGKRLILGRPMARVNAAVVRTCQPDFAGGPDGLLR